MDEIEREIRNQFISKEITEDLNRVKPFLF